MFLLFFRQNIFVELASKQDGVFDWSFAAQELRREQGLDLLSNARFVCRKYTLAK